MCLGIPAKLVEINGFDGVIDLGGVLRNCRLDMIPGAKLGDFILLHAGFGIEIVDEEEARQILETIEQAYGGIPV